METSLLKVFPSLFEMQILQLRAIVQPPVFGPFLKLVSGDAFSAPSTVLPKVQEVDNSELNLVRIHYILFSIVL